MQSELKAGKMYLKRLRGKKGLQAKDRLTVVCCSNATGNSRVPLAVIWELKQPVVFKKVHRPDSKWVCYTHQTNSWMDCEWCQWWFDTIFVPHVRSRHSGTVYLLWDNCAAHKIVNWHKDIIIILLPLNTHCGFSPWTRAS